MDVTRRSRTCALSSRAARRTERPDPGLRLLTKVLRELVTTQRFANFADLKHAFRRRLTALRIPYQPQEFDDAYALVGSNVRLVQLAMPATRRVVERVEDDRGFSKAEAAAFMAELPGLVRSMDAGGAR